MKRKVQVVQEDRKQDVEVALTEKQAAEFLGFSRHTLNNWRALGRGPKFIKYKSRAVRYRKCDLIEWRDAESTLCQNTTEAKVI